MVPFHSDSFIFSIVKTRSSSDLSVDNMHFILIVLFLSPSIFAAREQGEVYRLVEVGDGTTRVLRTVSNNAKVAFRNNVKNEEAKCIYQQRINETGWAFLECHSEASRTNEDQVYALGYLEGAITPDLIYMHWYNTLGDFCEGDGRKEMCAKLNDYVNMNINWIENITSIHGDAEDYWHHVKLFYLQLKGLADGYQYANKDPSKNLTYKDLLWLNLQGDFDDLSEVLKTQMSNFDENVEYLPLSARGLGHCSALIKVLPDGSDIFVAQDTWSSYQSMLRIQKKYVVSLKMNAESSDIIPGVGMSFSSYPGVITSGDDFYLISSGLATLETTIGNGNASLWRYVQPTGQVFEGVRSMVANRLATNGRTWANIFSKYNSGTYNNQWMIVDYNLFNKCKGASLKNLPSDLLWVLEQIPNYIQAADMTEVLRNNSYWASYNVAYFPMIFNTSGNQEMVLKFGDWFTYDKTPRALIFKRDHGKVQDTQSMLNLMRYNDYMHDPLSACDCNPPYSAENTISARCDLNPANGIYPFPALGHRQHGATDAKITSSELFENSLMFVAVSGPVFNESLGIPPFQWSKSDFAPTTPHLGHPDEWKFEPVMHQWV